MRRKYAVRLPVHQRATLVAVALGAIACLFGGVAAAAARGAAAAPATTTTTATGGTALPSASLYQLPLTIHDTTGNPATLAAFRGAPLVVTMFYGSCRAACPLIAHAVSATAQALPPSARGKVRFLLVTLDPANDSPQMLAHFAHEHGLDAPQVTVARTSADGVPLLAAALGIRYRRLADGSFSHTSRLTLLDAEGVPQARTEIIAGADPAFVKAVAAATAQR